MSLIERVESAVGADREIDWRIAEAVDVPKPWPQVDIWPPFMAGSAVDKLIPRYTDSADAAITLVPAGWGYLLAFRDGVADASVWEPQDGGATFEADAATPALALVAASLRARGIE